MNRYWCTTEKLFVLYFYLEHGYMRSYWPDSLPTWLIRHFRHHSHLDSRTSWSLQYRSWPRTDKKTIPWGRSVKYNVYHNNHWWFYTMFMNSFQRILRNPQYTPSPYYRNCRLFYFKKLRRRIRIQVNEGTGTSIKLIHVLQYLDLLFILTIIFTRTVHSFHFIY